MYIYIYTRCEIGFTCISRDKGLNAGRYYHPRPRAFGRRFVPGEGIKSVHRKYEALRSKFIITGLSHLQWWEYHLKYQNASIYDVLEVVHKFQLRFNFARVRLYPVQFRNSNTSLERQTRSARELQTCISAKSYNCLFVIYISNINNSTIFREVLEREYIL